MVLGVGAGLVALNFASTSGYRLLYERKVRRTLLEGVVPPPPAPAARLVDRADEAARVGALLRPERPQRFFSVVTGPAGAGKSTLLRAACREMGGGTGYLEVSPASDNFGRDLGETFNFRLDRYVSRVNAASQAVLGSKPLAQPDGSRLATLRRSADALRDAAAHYRSAAGRPFILIVDSVDRLCAQEEGKILDAFLAYANKKHRQNPSIS